MPGFSSRIPQASGSRKPFSPRTVSASSTFPENSAKRPQSKRSRVVFPAPFGPSSAKKLPCGISSDTVESASTSDLGYRNETFSSFNSGFEFSIAKPRASYLQNSLTASAGFLMSAKASFVWRTASICTFSDARCRYWMQRQSVRTAASCTGSVRSLILTNSRAW